MIFARFILGKFRFALVLCVLVGFVGPCGCSPEGAGSAPKLKGNKDELQKASQSGGANAPTKAKRR
jgi:hypothetical protein